MHPAIALSGIQVLEKLNIALPLTNKVNGKVLTEELCFTAERSRRLTPSKLTALVQYALDQALSASSNDVLCTLCPTLKKNITTYIENTSRASLDKDDNLKNLMRRLDMIGRVEALEAQKIYARVQLAIHRNDREATTYVAFVACYLTCEKNFFHQLAGYYFAKASAIDKKAKLEAAPETRAVEIDGSRAQVSFQDQAFIELISLEFADFCFMLEVCNFIRDFSATKNSCRDPAYRLLLKDLLKTCEKSEVHQRLFSRMFHALQFYEAMQLFQEVQCRLMNPALPSTAYALYMASVLEGIEDFNATISYVKNPLEACPLLQKSCPQFLANMKALSAKMFGSLPPELADSFKKRMNKEESIQTQEDAFVAELLAEEPDLQNKTRENIQKIAFDETSHDIHLTQLLHEYQETTSERIELYKSVQKFFAKKYGTLPGSKISDQAIPVLLKEFLPNGHAENFEDFSQFGKSRDLSLIADLVHEEYLAEKLKALKVFTAPQPLAKTLQEVPCLPEQKVAEEIVIQCSNHVWRWHDYSQDPFRDDPHYFENPSTRLPYTEREQAAITRWHKIPLILAYHVKKKGHKLPYLSPKDGTQFDSYRAAAEIEYPGGRARGILECSYLKESNKLCHMQFTQKEQSAMIQELLKRDITNYDFPALQTLAISPAQKWQEVNLKLGNEQFVVTQSVRLTSRMVEAKLDAQTIVRIFLSGL